MVRSTVLRNAGVLLSSQLVTWSLSLALALVLPRALGAVALGQLQLAASIWALATIFVTFGMDTLLIKEIARSRDRAADLFAASAGLRIALHLLAFVVVGGLVLVAGFPTQTAIIVCLAGVAGLAAQISGACQATLQGLERMEFVALGVVAGKLTNTVLCIALIWLGYGVVAVMLVGIVAALLTLAVQLAALRRLIPLRLALGSAAPRLLQSGLPYLLSGAVLVGYAQMDVLLLSLLTDERTIGWYGAAFQLFGTLLFLPVVLIAAIFPGLARSGVEDAAALRRLIGQGFDLLLVLGVPIGLGVAVIADPLVALLFGPEFAASGPVLAVLGIVLIVTYQNVLIGQVLIATDRQRAWTLVMVGALIMTLPLDLLLVRWCALQFGNGAIGGALSFLLTELGMLLAGLRLLPKAALGRANAGLAVRTLLAGLLMAGAAWLWRDAWLGLPILVGAVVYAALALPLRLVPEASLALQRMVSNKLRVMSGQ